jgi:hypothetical protein
VNSFSSYREVSFKGRTGRQKQAPRWALNPGLARPSDQFVNSYSTQVRARVPVGAGVCASVRVAWSRLNPGLVQPGYEFVVNSYTSVRVGVCAWACVCGMELMQGVHLV